MDPPQSLHRRKSSKESDETITPTTTNGYTPFPSQRLAPPPPSPRNRVQSSPVGGQHTHARSISSTLAQYPTSPLNGSYPYTPSFQLGPPPRGHGRHARMRSISAFAPPSPSPLSASFPTSSSSPNDGTTTPTTTSGGGTSSHVFPTSNSAPETTSAHSPPSSPKLHRHTRLHSRNLSVFFPRPGSLPHSAISEDGTQELELGLKDDDDNEESEEAPVIDLPAAGASVHWRRTYRQPVTPLGVGFTFGGRSAPIPPPMVSPSVSGSSASSISSRRGHHHKHSLSHNFFSFLEPGANGIVSSSTDSELHSQPTPTPISPWTKTHALPAEGPPEKSVSPTPSLSPIESPRFVPEQQQQQQPNLLPAIAVSLCQFAIGAWFWVVSQQVGSLACTGLGYWLVFDSFGVAIEKVVPKWLEAKSRKKNDKDKVRRPYGNARVETVLMFAQAVYLMFSAVYVCKETVEHVLLSAGPTTGEKHHHHFHPSEENGIPGIDFPTEMVFVALMFLIGTAIKCNNHANLVNITDTWIPPLSSLIRSLLTGTKRTYHEPPPTTQPALMMSNPYIASPLFICVSVLFIALFVPPSQHEACDMILAALIAIVTFKAAYHACVVLGTVLLQTAPPRGLPGGKMEAFLRVMRELERHPQVLHLPAPHIWQLAPVKRKGADPLIVTLELRVKPELGEEDVLNLTRLAWEKCMLALGGDIKRTRGEGGPEVTVGVVRG